MHDCTKGWKVKQRLVSVSHFVCEIQDYWAAYAAMNLDTKN